MGRLLAPLFTLLAAGCFSDTPVGVIPFAEDISSAPVTARIVESAEGVEATNNPKFTFLPPLTQDPDFVGPFDPAARPEVQVCELDGEVCGPVVVTFTMDLGAASETIRLSLEDEHFIVNWHTDEFALSDNAVYRVSILLGGRTLGSDDVRIVSNAGQAKKAGSDEIFALKDGRTLPIKFRIREGALGLVIDARALTAPLGIGVGVIPDLFPVNELIQVDLDPGTYRVSAVMGSMSFTVTDEGLIDFDPAFDANLSGRGIATLTITP